MTIGIAAICNRGENVIVTTDGMLSSEISADLSTYKMQFLGDWLFVFSGTLSNADLIMEEIRLAAAANPETLTRAKIQGTLRRAYKKRYSQWAADRHLAPYDMEMDEFKKKGAKVFGERRFTEIEDWIRQDAVNFNEHIMVTGWGGGEKTAMIYTVNQDGGTSSSLTGFAAIGSGSNVATNALMSLGCARHVPFEYVLYAVAAAKFFAESCEGVGESTAMVVTHKRTPVDASGMPPHQFVQPDQVKLLRNLWETHSRLKVPEEGIRTLCLIAQVVLGKATPDAAIRAIMHTTRPASRTQTGTEGTK